MDKLPICRICLVENVSMYVVVNKNLHELYEKLTDIPFVTEDRRPILACFFCCAKLKQCFRFLKKCLEAEEHFAQMMKEDYEPKPSISQDHLYCSTGFIKSPMVHVSVGDECGTDSIAIKEEVPAICDGQDDVIEPKEEYQSDGLDLENLNNTCLGVEDIHPHLSESGGDVKIEQEEVQELSNRKRRAVETNNLENLNDTCLSTEDVPPHLSESVSGDDINIEEEEELELSKRKRRAVETNNLDLENLNDTCLSTEDVPPHLSESDSGDDINIEVEEELELFKRTRRAVETNIFSSDSDDSDMEVLALLSDWDTDSDEDDEDSEGNE